MAVTYADPRYLTAYIEFTPHAAHLWEEQDLVILHEAIVHEVVHVLLAPLQRHAEKSASPQTKEHLTDILEQTTQRITRVILALLPHDYFA